MSDTYELFDTENQCKVELPTNPIKDEFTFIAFAPLHAQIEKGRTKPVAVPRDYVNPEVMRRVRFGLRSLPPYVSDEFVRGVPFNPDWSHWIDPWDEIEIPPLSPGGGTYIVPDIDTFLENPRIKLGARGYVQLTLSQKNRQSLLLNGTASVAVALGERRAWVNLIAKKPSRTGQVTGFPTRLSSTLSSNASFGLPTLENLPSSLDHFDDYMDRFAPPKLDFLLCLPYRQTWKLLGYSRGELLNTISLAPEEETTIEITTWDKLTSTQEETIQEGREGLLETTLTDKDTLQTVKDTTEENKWNFNAKLEPTIPIAEVPVKIGEVGGGREHKLTDVNTVTRDRVSEAVRRSSLKLTSSRQTKVTENRETGREDKAIRKIKNPNMCHTLNLDYFEILNAYEVTTALKKDQVRLCVLVPNLIKDEIDRNFILNYMEVLKRSFLYNKDHRGFAAARKLAAWENLCLVKCKEPCPCDQTVPVNDRSGPLPHPGNRTVVTRLLRSASRLRNSLEIMTSADIDDFCKKGGDKIIFHRWFYWQIATNARLGLGSSAETFVSNTASINFNDQSDENVEQIVALVEGFLEQISPTVLKVLVGILTWSRVTMLEFIAEWLQHLGCSFKFLFHLGLDDANFSRELQNTRTALQNYNRMMSGGPANSSQPGDEESSPYFEEITKPYSDQEIAEALVDEGSLIAHIRNNESYYRQAIWESLGANDQLKLLSLLGRIRDFVEPEILGFVGDKLVMPYRLSSDDHLKAWLEEQKQQVLDENEKIETLTLPTKGVVFESRLGKCGACEEFIVEHRKKDLRQKEAEVTAAEEKAVQEKLETKRYEERLNQDPPLLDDPDSNENEQPAIRVILEKRGGD